MNFSNLPVFYSKENLTNRFVDNSNVYLLPSICWFGIVTSFLCLVVSIKRDDSNAKTLNYILINSFIDFTFLLIQSFLFIIRCGALCPYGYKYFSKFYEIYIYLYVGYILVTSQVLLNIYVAYDRLKMFSGKLNGQAQISIFKVYAICVLISTFANALPYLIARNIIILGIYKPDGPNSTESDTLYIRTYRDEFNTLVWQNVITVVYAIKDPCLFIVLCGVSILVCFRFRAFLQSRKVLLKRVVATDTTSMNAASNSATNNSAKQTLASSSSNDKKENNLTFLTILYCVKILVGNFIDSFGLFLNIFNVDVYVKYGFINITGNSLFFASHGIPIFLYYFFYNVFRKKFLEMFCCRKSS